MSRCQNHKKETMTYLSNIIPFENDEKQKKENEKKRPNIRRIH